MFRAVSPLNAAEEDAIARALDCAFAVHRELGPGFREKIYQAAYCLEMDARGIKFERERKIDVVYKQWTIPGQQVDLVVEGLVLVELKSVPKLLKVHERQVRSYLKTMRLRAGLLVNFNVALLKNGLRRVLRT